MPQGYDVPEVEDLLDRIAAELDAGRPAWPLIENTTVAAAMGPEASKGM